MTALVGTPPYDSPLLEIPPPLPSPPLDAPLGRSWTEADYLAFDTNRLVEYSDGIVEVLPMPTIAHQRIVAYLYMALAAHAAAGRLGECFFAPTGVRLWPGKVREPALVFLLASRSHLASHDALDALDGADLVMEVVSENRALDLETKRSEYARAGISEYWIVDPRDRRITVLTLAGDSYAEAGAIGMGEVARSVLLEGFGVEVERAVRKGGA